MPTVAFFDVDGTLTTTNLWKAYMAYFQVHGLRRWTHRAFMAVHLPQYFLHKLGLMQEEPFRRRWAAHLAWYVRGLTLEEAEPIWTWAVETYLKPYWRQESVARLQEHLERGDTVVLVSAAPLPLIRRVARHLGTPHAVATAFEVRKGRYTGRAVPPVCIGREKPRRAFAYLREQGIPFDPKQAWAYADAISDLALLEAVGHPVVVAPQPPMEALARERGWEIYGN